eukprot:CAMPEP_0172455992 /NCGR_PEP_ID=MMETSP1065-20121228/13567_1 /TAXON_ID=265537 /ORGANISM="Amphiprora paludosa, Strain CCMP125" /LENGTH=322 /DNA_ID=CAMNT_0013208585 /DNA_START=26 /DNA_END=994 /DNA_ORIENTATION=+
MMKIYASLPLIAFLTSVSAYVPAFPKESVVPYVKPIRTDEIGVTFDNLHEVFGQIQEASPLAKMVMQPEDTSRERGFAGIESLPPSSLKWKTVEKKKSGPVSQIERCDNFNGIKTPLLRFRSQMSGPCVGEYFGKYILDLESRKKWDATIADVYEIHEISDLDPVNIAMGFGRCYGDVTRMGIGYGQTKPSMGVTAREQMFLYGMQDFADGSCVLWGTELDDKYNHLLPEGKRHTRARSHLFSATLTPTGSDTFDIEYLVQLEIGGGVPSFLTTPVVIDTVKNLFKTAKSEYAKREEELNTLIAEQESRDHVGDRHMLLMPL